MPFLTPAFFDTLILVVIFFGLAAAIIRLYQDLSRKSNTDFSESIEEDTQQHPPIKH